MTSKKNTQDCATNIKIDDEINFNITRHTNVDQNYITITEDKATIILTDLLKKHDDKNAWKTPTSIFGTLLLAKITTEKFKDFFLLSGQWETVISTLTFLSVLWASYSITKSIKNRNTSPLRNAIEAMKKTNKDV